MSTKRLVMLLCGVSVFAGSVVSAHAHGMVGQRFFPATLATDDPFVADELSLPTILYIKTPPSGDSPSTKFTSLSGELSKRLSPDLGLSLSGAWDIVDPQASNSHTLTGFENMEVNLKYVLFKSAPHEFLFSVGLTWEVGGTGSKKVGADSFDTLTPQIYFGKGMGDLPEAVEWLRPAAVTGVFGWAVPTRVRNQTITTDPNSGDVDVEREFNPTVFQWGFSTQYSLQYLQSFVRDVGLPAPFNRMIPLVEIALQTPIDGPNARHTTGFVYPGIIWSGRYMQLGLEAVIPINTASGRNVGVLAQIHFYLDDIAPKVFTWTPFSGTLGPTQPR